MHCACASSFLLALITFSLQLVDTTNLVPVYPPTWAMNESTIIQPCNSQGYTNPNDVKYWGWIDWDWSNAKKIWAVAKPMNCAELLLKQVQMVNAFNPRIKNWVYRNSIKALPWFTSVRETLEDPAYSVWFMKFKPNGTYHVPVCDTNYNPPLCSNYYHDQEQTPGYPHGDGTCAAPACDVGSIPVGEYLWDHRAWNVSVKGITFGNWFIEKYVFDETGGANPLVHGFFFDDAWTVNGPTEFESHAVEDMGLTGSELVDITNAYREAMKEVYNTVVQRGKWSWQQFSRTTVSNTTCARDLRNYCGPASPTQKQFTLYTFNLVNRDPSHLAEFQQDLANFLLIRGPYAVLGNGWESCNKNYAFPDALNLDYGTPTGFCSESSSGVFRREYTKASVEMNCNTWTPTITMK